MTGLAFGPFRIDRRSAVLSRQGVLVPLSPRLVEVLACLAEARGALVTREVLLDRFWPDVTVTDNTLTRAVADIRKALGDDAASPTYVQTMARRGYRFVAPVSDEAPEPGPAGMVPVPDALAGLEPFLAWERGRAALESLHADALPQAAEAFSRAVSGAPGYAPAHAGLANAHLFRYEATRVDDTPDLAALATALAAARRATELDPALAEGWAALGHADAASGRADEARAALRQALALEPRNWRHHYRMAAVSWGEERLRAVERAEALLPGFPPTETLAAMVLVVRQAFDAAAEAVARGAAAGHTRSPFPATGLLWMRGVIAFATGDRAAAAGHFRAEVETATAARTIYARECAILAHESLGFALLADRDASAARESFTASDALSPGHARAVLGLALAGGTGDDIAAQVSPATDRLAASGKHGERVLVLAAAEAWSGRPADGLARIDAALDAAAAGPFGWSLPAEPMFAPLRAADGYARLAARLAGRAA